MLYSLCMVEINFSNGRVVSSPATIVAVFSKSNGNSFCGASAPSSGESYILHPEQQGVGK